MNKFILLTDCNHLPIIIANDSIKKIVSDRYENCTAIYTLVNNELNRIYVLQTADQIYQLLEPRNFKKCKKVHNKIIEAYNEKYNSVYKTMDETMDETMD